MCSKSGCDEIVDHGVRAGLLEAYNSERARVDKRNRRHRTKRAESAPRVFRARSRGGYFFAFLLFGVFDVASFGTNLSAAELMQ